MTVQYPQDQSKDDQIAQLKKQIALFNVMQYVMPLFMLILAACIPSNFPSVAPENKNVMVGVLCVFAVMDFGLIRFMILPMAKKRLGELENS